MLSLVMKGRNVGTHLPIVARKPRAAESNKTKMTVQATNMITPQG
jgi:hypothetical protein